MEIVRYEPPSGVAAIATALAHLHGYDVQPAHWGPQRPMRDGGDDPLDGVSAFPAGDTWHYVTYGLSQLGDDVGSFPHRPGASGFGFELTFRLSRHPGEPAPVWPVLMLQRLARYVFRSANVFRPGDHMDLQEPMGGHPRSEIVGAVFTADPQLPPIQTRHGEVAFVQVVGVASDELEAVKDWSCEAFLRLLATREPLFVTDVLRPSYMRDRDFAAACARGAREDGSSHGSSFASAVRWNELVTERGPGVELVIGAIAVPDVLRALRLRLPYNRPFRLQGRRGAIRFVPALATEWRTEGRDLVVGVPWDAAAAMAEGLRPKRGRYPWPGMPGVVFVVEPTDIRGARGELVRVIG